MHYLHLAFEPKTFKRALHVAFFVGIILNAINHPEVFMYLYFGELNVYKVLLTFLVPFLVSSYSSVLANSGSLKSGKISNIDALLQCNSCKTTNFNIVIGDELQDCPNCKKPVKWNVLKRFSSEDSDGVLIKSLALFARHNPQPLLRVDHTGIIRGANAASEALFAGKIIQGEPIVGILPELHDIDIPGIILKDGIVYRTIHINGRIFHFTMKGIPSIKTLNIYANEITEIVMAQNKIREQAKDINDSILYARNIQHALLPDDGFIKTIFPDCFVFYRPKNVVSGDYYWVNQIDNIKIVVVADCTGHGVPGAFMSMLGISLLNEIVLHEKILNPGQILDSLRKRLIQSLSTRSQLSAVQDGMDISLAVINCDTHTLGFAGAYNPLFIARSGDLIKMEADKMPVGNHIRGNLPFTTHEIQLTPKDCLYFFTDGFNDQSGGERNKKYSSRAFRELLIELGKLPMIEQSTQIATVFDNWKMNEEQVDDVLVMGILIE
jgi:serine phosphatase RsbU (regulator of sigma subunit)